MITDLFTGRSSYTGISPILVEAFAYIEEYLAASTAAKPLRSETSGTAEKPAALPGREEVKLIYPSYDTQPQKERLFELHRSCIDLQYLIEGRETIYWAPAEELAVECEYEEERDIGFLSGEARASFLLSEGCFAVFFPQDAHKPNCIAADVPERVRKLVCKIPVSLL